MFGGKPEGDSHTAGAALLFDRFRQDQVVGIMHEDVGNRRRAGLTVWDRRDEPFPAIGGATRLFAGRTDDHDAVVELRDGAARVRLRLVVPREGDPRVETLDQEGVVAAVWPA